MKSLDNLVGSLGGKQGIFLLNLPWEILHFRLPIFKEFVYHKNNGHAFHKTINKSLW